MDCLTKEKKDKKIIIWTLDGSPKFYQIEFKTINLSSNYNLKIVWNRPIKGLTTNAITIKFSHSDVFFEEKTVSTTQFIFQSKELIEDLFSEMNKKLLLQGLTIDEYDLKIKKKTNKYIEKIIKYINKKEEKQKNKTIAQV